MNKENFEILVLKEILSNDNFMRKVIPYIKLSYFETPVKLIFKEVCKYVTKYNEIPSKESLSVEVFDNDISPDAFSNIKAAFEKSFSGEKSKDYGWILDKTEKWCQNRAIYLSILESIDIIDGKSKDHQKGAIPEILKNALSVSFSSNIGHDYISDSEERFEYYAKEENHLPFDIDMLNRITDGGMLDKCLYVALAGTNVGKSMLMCHIAASTISMGHNVLYISAEMSEMKISHRIDANLMNISMGEFGALKKEVFKSKIQKLASKSIGTLITKEYPTGAASADHFRILLDELNLKKNFTPRLIIVDYLNICASARLKSVGGSVNSYTYIKAIAEELRGLAVEYGIPLLTATQTNRSGYQNTDVDLVDTSESFGLPATADVMFAVMRTEELDKKNLLMIKQLKNRYGDVNKNKRFVVGVDLEKMRLYDAPSEDQNLQDSKIDDPVAQTNSTSKFDNFKI